MNTFLKFLLLSCQVRIDPLLWGGGGGGGGGGAGRECMEGIISHTMNSL